MNKQCFISHCSDDSDIIRELGEITDECYDVTKYQFFNTSLEIFSTKAHKGLSSQLRQVLGESEVMIAVVTDSYIRSHICITELCSFWYMNKPVIPLIYSDEGKRFVQKLMGEDKIYIDLSSEESDISRKALADKMINTLQTCGFFSIDDNATNARFEKFFRTVGQANPIREYIGSADVYKKINEFCNKSGITRITNANLSDDYLLDKLTNCKSIYILSTTGSNLVSKLAADFIPQALANGTDIYMLLPNRDSEFIVDVAEIEAPSDAEQNERRFARQFDEVVFNLKDSLNRSREIQPEGKGEVYLGCTYTLLRQTVTLAVYEDGSVWGWISVTIPPKRTIGDTTSMEFEGITYDNSFAANVFYHVESIKKTAERRSSLIKLSDHLTGDAEFRQWENTNNASSEGGIEGCINDEMWRSAETNWQNMYNEAILNTSVKQGDMELIEVAAQHPLKSDGTPGREFALRLDYAARIYQEIKKTGTDVNIYVPGSVHCYNGKSDATSLSQAGVEYLIGKGIPKEDLLGVEKNLLYKGEEGVYNTADECYVASEIFKEGYYRRLHCVCSPNQILRKKLFYIAFGVIPFYYTVSSETLAHNDIYEFFHAVPDVILYDHTWQAKDSVNGQRTRSERKPELVLAESKERT